MFTVEMQEAKNKTLIIDEEENDNEELFEYLLKSVHFQTVTVPFSKVVEYEAIFEKYQMESYSEIVRQEILKQLRVIPNKSALISQFNSASDELIHFICQHLDQEIVPDAFVQLHYDKFIIFAKYLFFKQTNKVNVTLQWLKYEKEREKYALQMICLLKLESVSLNALFQIAQSFYDNFEVKSHILQLVFQKSKLGEIPTTSLQYQFIDRVDSLGKTSSAWFKNFSMTLQVAKSNNLTAIIPSTPLYLSKIQIFGMPNTSTNYTLSIFRESNNAIINRQDSIEIPSAGRAMIPAGLYLEENVPYSIVVTISEQGQANFRWPTLRTEAMLPNGTVVMFKNDLNAQFPGFEFGYRPRN